MYGRTHTPEARAKISAANKRQFSDPMARERHALLTCKQIQEGRTGKSYNRLEQTVAGMLKDRNISYLQQYRLGRYVFDFFLPASNTLIEVNGRFWHADPRFYNHTSLSPVQVHNTANDIRKAIRALQDGFSIRILWEDDIKDGSAIIVEIRSDPELV